MKLISLCGLLLAIGCGRVIQPDSFNITRSFEPLVISDSHRAALASLCNQLSQKAVFLDRSIGRTFDFGFAQKTCAEEELGATANVTVTATKEGQDYLFKQGNTLFQFQYIETNNSGMMKEICKDVGALTNPYKASNGSAVWLSFGASSEDCPVASGQICLLLETGSANVTGDSYNIHTRDWLRFITNPNEALVGFYSHRKMQTKGFCKAGQFSEIQAQLK